jgi:hypothetical protein
MSGTRAGAGLMTAGAIVIIVGLGIVLVRTFEVPRYWVPLLVGIALFVFGAIRWATSREG